MPRWRLVIASLSVCAMLMMVLSARSIARCRSGERVIIVGAGAAGLAAAQALTDTAATVIVLEAQQRPGGRIHTNHSLGTAVDLGAVWIHRAKGNVVTGLAEQFGCRRFVTRNKALHLYDESGHEYSEAEVNTAYTELQRDVMPKLLRRRAALGALDTDLESIMREIPPFRAEDRAADESMSRRRCILDFLLFRDIVQDHTADLVQSSAKHYDTDFYGGKGKDELLPAGYDCIIRGLASGLDVRYGRGGETVAVQWSGGRTIEVSTADGRTHVAERVILTVPLGVLKAGLLSDGGPIRFKPHLPPRVVRSLQELGYGEATKVALRFDGFFWPRDAHFLGKVSGGCDGVGSARHMEFLNVGAYSGEPVLLMETETANARRLAALDDEAAVASVMKELRLMFPRAPWPTHAIVARLGNDSFQRGGFSYMPPHASPDLFSALSSPLYGSRLFLAGEHTSVFHPGTVHGAIVSGRLAAAHVRGAMYGDPLEGSRYADNYWEKLQRQQDEEEELADEWDRNP